jgi:hypothetical protein
MVEGTPDEARLSCIFRAIATGIPTRLRPLFRFDHDRQSGGFTTGVPEHCDRLN